MIEHRHPFAHSLRNTRGGAASVVIVMILILAAAAGGGYWVYTKFLKAEPPRAKLSSLKVKAELVQFSHEHVSRALHTNMITVDDVVVMLDKELKRLKGIGKQFPEQRAIVDPRVKALTTTRTHLATALKDVTGVIETIYVTWLVDRSRGVKEIRSQKGTLTKTLADVIREHAELIRSIRNNPSSAS